MLFLGKLVKIIFINRSVFIASGIIMDAERLDYLDAEARALLENCEFFSKFINDIEKRGTDDLSPDYVKILDNFKKKLGNFSSPVKNPEPRQLLRESIMLNRELDGNFDENVDVVRKTGAIPKIHKLDQSKRKNTINSSTSDSPEGSSAESEDYDFSNISKSKTYRSKKEEFMSIWKRMDNRQIPKFGKFNEDSGQSLCKYLERFESYCSENLKGGCEFWCSELENYLQGGVLENFRLLKDEDDDYYITKTRLLKWFKGNDKIRKQSLKNKF